MFKTVSRLAAAAVIVGSVFAASNSALAASSLLSVVSRDNNEYDIVITKDSVGINMLQVVLNCAASEDAVFKADAADWGEFKQNRKPDQLGFMISSTGTVGAGNANKVLRAGMAVASVKCAKAPAITFKDSWQNTGVGFATMQSITDTGIETHVMCVDISKSSVNSVKSGDTFTLSADIYPTAAKVKDIVWSSSAPDVVSVDSSGKVTALSDTGSADITVSTVEGGFEDTCRVTLVNNPKPDPDTKPTPAPSDGGGGCNTGMGALLLLSALPVFFRKKF